jgi:phosphoribosylamine--glycine ligase / phosphoribosylformylglycinamidine cyclo-ligase
MEGSKAFSKDFMAKYKIPTAEFRTFREGEFENACEWVRRREGRVVVKASGLAGGKGVIIPETLEETIKALEEVMVQKAFGRAGMQTSPLLQLA